jgi:cytoskeletal protein CcmA (bactofilin family)
MAKAPKGAKRTVRCYLCGHAFEVSARAMSTTCSGCNKAIKIEDLTVKSYVPVNDVQTCGRIKVTRRGRIVARTVRSGDGIALEGAIEGRIETDGDLAMGAKSSWKGDELQSQSLTVKDGATLSGYVCVPWIRGDEEDEDSAKATTKKPGAKKAVTKKVAGKTTTTKKTTSKTASKKTTGRKSASETTPKTTKKAASTRTSKTTRGRGT